LLAEVNAAGVAVCDASLAALPCNGWRVLQLMLPELSSSFNDAPCNCMIRFGDTMSVFGSDAAAPTSDPHKLLKLCKDFVLKTQRESGGENLDVTDSSVDCVFVHPIIGSPV
jgi:hypothetical protein